jgi:transcriptional regulator with XRE-family HTH domain
MRRELRLTQPQLALIVGVHPNTVACWERGDKPIGNPEMLRLALQQVRDRQLPPFPPPTTTRPLQLGRQQVCAGFGGGGALGQ